MPTFVVIAHEFPAQLARLAGRLEPHPMIVHVNARFDQAPFEEAVAGRSNVTFLPASQRIGVNWAGMTIVHAMRNLFRAALRVTAPHDHIVLLSGVDYPLRPIEEFVEWLRDAPFRQHIRFFDAARSDDHQRSLPFRRHYRDVAPFPRAPRGSMRANANEVVKRTLSLAMRWRPPPACPADITPMRGWLWCALTAECVADVLDHTTDPLDRWLSRVFSPDEVYLPSVVAATRHGADSELGGTMPYPGRSPSRFASIHLIDDSLDKWFTIADLPVVERSDKWFIRKVAPPVSDSLLDELDRRARLPRTGRTTGSAEPPGAPPS